MNKDQLKKLEADLWSAADKLRANSDFKPRFSIRPLLRMVKRLNLREKIQKMFVNVE